MNIACLLGSPRSRGNSAAIARRFCETAEALGGRIRLFELNKLNYRGCQACMLCKTKLDGCALNDDLAPVLKEAAEAEVLVVATPVYYGDVSSQLKGFLDRTYSYLKPDYLTAASPSRLVPDKRLVFILTQGHPDEAMFNDVFPRYERFFRWYGFREGVLLRACGLSKPDDIAGREEILKRAEEAAREIMEGR